MTEPMTQVEYACSDEIICPICRRDAIEYEGADRWTCYYCGTKWVVLHKPQPIAGYGLIRIGYDGD